jgi:simple sugar transport system ATP-binding protein
VPCDPGPERPSRRANPGASGSVHVELVDIAKRFGETVALDGASLDLLPGEIHALLGENGAGKTTLVGALYGLVRPDRGEIRMDGRPIGIRSPRHALALGIGLVHQDSALVPALSVAENLALGRGGRFWLSAASVRRRARRVLEAHGLELDPALRARELPVASRQRLEIVRALDRGVRVLVLDEPTAVLAPSEAEALLRVLGELRDRGHTVALISHKLEEITAVCDRVTVLRCGRTVATRPVRGLDPRELGRWMVGHEVSPPGGPPGGEPGPVALRARRLRSGELEGVGLELHAGEILAIAGIDGNGQSSLEELLAGVRSVEGGKLEVLQPPLALIAGDRQRTGLVLGLSVEENLALPDAARGTSEPFRRGLLRREALSALAREAIARFGIQGAPRTLAAALSGGNQQRLLVARAVRGNPGVLVCVNPTRGLDVNGTAFVRAELREAARRGAGVLLVSTDLDEVLELGSRIGVLFRGRLTLVERGRESRARIGELMLGRAA